MRPEVSGRIQSIGFRDGQAVRRGQLLVGLDATLNEAEVAQARAEFDLAASNLKRTEDLASKSFISSSAQDQAASGVQVAEARLKLAEARLARCASSRRSTAWSASATSASRVRQGRAELVNVEDIRTLKVDFRLPERYFTQLRSGLSVEVSPTPCRARATSAASMRSTRASTPAAARSRCGRSSTTPTAGCDRACSPACACCSATGPTR